MFYYLTVTNENYAQPAMPDGVKEGILRGFYRFRAPLNDAAAARVHLLGSGTILNEVVKAQELLHEQYGIAADVYSVTSYKNLHTDALDCERWNLLHPGEALRIPYVAQVFRDHPAPFVAASDYVKALPESISKWLPASLHSLGTDGFGRSEGRARLRDYFEVDARHVAYAALYQLFRAGELPVETLRQAAEDLGIQPDRMNPAQQGREGGGFQ